MPDTDFVDVLTETDRFIHAPRRNSMGGIVEKPLKMNEVKRAKPIIMEKKKKKKNYYRLRS